MLNGIYRMNRFLCFIRSTTPGINRTVFSCKKYATNTVDDGLACFDQGGVVAEMGARILYLLTRQDGLGWHHAGYNDLPFHVDRQNWLDYLADRCAGGEQSVGLGAADNADSNGQLTGRRPVNANVELNRSA